MKRIWAEQALLPEGWREGVRVTLAAGGRIAGVEAGVAAEGADRVGLLLPAPANSHSHAFQRAMAGLTERRGDGTGDSFWTWRQLMYRFLDRITPDQVEAIAAFVQMEMLEAGYATNVEFHYLHHRPDGTPHDDIAEMSARIAAAADHSGIGLTLLPVAYRFGGLDGRALGPGQRRFGTEPAAYVRLLEGAARALDALPGDAVLGVAPHSLRAVAPGDLAVLAALRPDAPIHMHLAETLAEVDEVRGVLGARPVEWMLNNVGLSPRWCLIHITQMTPEETGALAATGAVAGLCPLTEASLGDGIFDGVRWMSAGGAISLGSDSNIRISLAEELRQLDTSQRLRDHSRAALATADLSTGRRLFQAAAMGGAQAAGRDSGRIEPGLWGDLLALDMTHPDLEGLRGDTVLDAFAFAGDSAMVAEVWAAGRHMVTGGRHIRREAITAAYRHAVRSLRAGA
ncbi:formimidoylglutamate deiminase [Aliigemmobacter aestuarii]|uniref:Formimidoylglutamate deiminase n=1 Tax=Aliigemmobacter aestuarii TaxID=1445661 RepID=A0A4S3MIX5_9RHOB|nr:formimidoylglutamate deiminase [Gemmobacter aestuarii]THD81355.1 formimidoylglutamate deiminase [Gemmobacter aestuarii]